MIYFLFEMQNMNLILQMYVNKVNGMKWNYLKNKIKPNRIKTKRAQTKVKTNPISQNLYKIGHEVHDGGETLQTSYF